MDLIDELLERDAGTVNSTIIGKLHKFSKGVCATTIYLILMNE